MRCKPSVVCADFALRVQGASCTIRNPLQAAHSGPITMRAACVTAVGLAETLSTTCGIRMQVSKRVPLRIECARVGGVEIPNQKFIEYSLQYIYGVGHTTAKAILVETVSQYQHLFRCLGVHLPGVG